jgi:hypothetical protein
MGSFLHASTRPPCSLAGRFVVALARRPLRRRQLARLGRLRGLLRCGLAGRSVAAMARPPSPPWLAGRWLPIAVVVDGRCGAAAVASLAAFSASMMERGGISNPGQQELVGQLTARSSPAERFGGMATTDNEKIRFNTVCCR